MSKYIDVGEVTSRRFITDRHGVIDGVRDYISFDEICNIPPADVVPVVHAHWEYFKIESKCKLPFSPFDMECSFVEGGWKCSNCNMPLGFLNHSENLKLDYAYCPHCGAKIDEEEKNG